MKLGDLKGERAIEVIADLIAPIANIATDPKNKDFFRMEKREGEDDRTAAARELKKKIPFLLKEHKADVLAILCSIENKNPNDLSIVDIVSGMVELANDQEFLNLFLSSANRAEPTQPTESSVIADLSEPES